MIKGALLLLLFIQMAFSASFMEICKNPNEEQLKTLQAIKKDMSISFIPRRYNKEFRGQDCPEMYRFMKWTKHLILNGNGFRVTDISLLKEFPNIKELTLRGRITSGGSNVSDIRVLKYLRNLEGLRTTNNPISDLSPLKDLGKMQRLSIGDGRHHLELSPLKDLENMISLDIMALVDDLTPITKLTKLEWVAFIRNRITNVCPLANMINMKELYLQNNQITDISCLSKLTKLESLNIRHNKVSSINVVTNYPKLRTLYIDNNPVSDISAVRGMQELEYFSAEDTNVDDLSPLVGLPKIRIVKADVEKLRHCSPKNIEEIKAGISCYEADGTTLKPWWKRLMRW